MKENEPELEDLSPKAQSQAVSGALERDSVPVDETWELKLDDLAPGLYRVSVQVGQSRFGAPNAVHDVFEVTEL